MPYMAIDRQGFDVKAKRAVSGTTAVALVQRGSILLRYKAVGNGSENSSSSRTNKNAFNAPRTQIQHVK